MFKVRDDADSRFDKITEEKITVYSLETGEQKILLNGIAPVYSSGHILFGRGGSLWAVPFDTVRLITAGEPFLVLGDVNANVSGNLYARVAHDGTLIYLPRGTAEPARSLVWVDRLGREEPVAALPRSYEGLRLSPDERRVAVVVGDATASDVLREISDARPAD